MLATYHVDDPVVFYNATDRWSTPADPTAVRGNQPPYYVIADDLTRPGSQQQFQVTSPMNVLNSDFLAAFVTVNSDPLSPDYGKMTMLHLRGAENVPGPVQSHKLITTESTITT